MKKEKLSDKTYFLIVIGFGILLAIILTSGCTMNIPQKLGENNKIIDINLTTLERDLAVRAELEKDLYMLDEINRLDAEYDLMFPMFYDAIKPDFHPAQVELLLKEYRKDYASDFNEARKYVDKQVREGMVFPSLQQAIMVNRQNMSHFKAISNINWKAVGDALEEAAPGFEEILAKRRAEKEAKGLERAERDKEAEAATDARIEALQATVKRLLEERRRGTGTPSVEWE